MINKVGIGNRSLFLVDLWSVNPSVGGKLMSCWQEYPHGVNSDGSVTIGTIVVIEPTSAQDQSDEHSNDVPDVQTVVIEQSAQ